MHFYLGACRLGSAICAGVILTTFVVAADAGQVATDGSLGARRTLSGPNFSIGPDLGQKRGGNLFHSFNTFDLSKGEVATFSGHSSVHNVFARVTGGQPSSIDGTLRCTIPNAGFYLINPSGLIFGPDAALDVKGSFAVTTADYIKHADGTAFPATAQPPAVLSSVPPAAFGFLGPRPAGISVEAHLASAPGTALSVVGGAIHIVNARIEAPGGRLNLASVAAPGAVGLESAPGGPRLNASAISHLGLLRIVNSVIDASGSRAGAFQLNAGECVVDQADVNSFTLGSRHGLASTVLARDGLEVRQSFIRTGVVGTGPGGDLSVFSPRILVTAAPQSLNGIFTTGGNDISGASGPAGNLRVTGGQIRIEPGGQIGALNFSNGHGGDLTLQAKTLHVDGGLNSLQSSIFTTTAAAGQGGDISIRADTVQLSDGAHVQATSSGLAKSGSVRLMAREIGISDGALIGSGAFGHGDGGNVSVRAWRLRITDDKPASFTGITAETDDVRSPARSGTLAIFVRHADLSPGTRVDTSTFSRGRAGNLTLETPPMGSIQNQGFIGSTSLGSGHGGKLRVKTGLLHVFNSGLLDTSTYGTGDGGDIGVVAEHVLLEDVGVQILEQPSGLYSRSTRAGTGGRGGNINIRTTRLDVLSGAQVLTSTFSSQPAGRIDINAGDLLIDALGSPLPAGGPRGGINANTVAAGAGGDIHLTFGHAIISNGASVGASSGRGGTGLAGSITFDGGSLDVRNAGSVATSAPNSGGGNILVNVTGNINLASAILETKAVTQGGNLTLNAGRQITVFKSTLSTNTPVNSNGNGGNINIDPTIVTLNGANINASGGNNGGNVTINPTFLLKSSDTLINATGHGGGVNGQVLLTSPDESLVSSLARLPGNLYDVAFTLQPECGQMLDVSTFLIQGRGAVAEEPGFWQMDFDLQPVTPSREHQRAER